MQNNTKKGNYELCFIHELKPGNVVFEDLYVENRRLLSKGHVLTERIINVLRNRNIQQVAIEKTSLEMKAKLPVDESISISFSVLDQMMIDMGHEYLSALGVLSSEIRYGKILNNSDHIQLLKKMFANFMKNPTIYKYFTNLKSHDANTYLHSIDVYTIGTLFAISEGIDTFEDAALGFLFHDIGKIQTAGTLLNKPDNLTTNEFSVIQHHPEQGFEILCNNGFEQIAHYAKYHHERLDGSGYPEGLQGYELSHELQILQIVDAYSAMTLERPYKTCVCASVALEKLFSQVPKFNRELINRFVDFIGIYPENAVVLLSDGTQAVIEKVNSLYPLLPDIKIFQTGEIIQLPMDFSLSINKLLTFHHDTPEQLFSKFSDFLISNEEEHMLRYYEKLKEHYRQSEWFTHIYLPVFHVFRVIDNYNMVPEMRFEEVKNTLLALLENTLRHFRQADHSKQKILLLVDDLHSPAIIKLFEGLLHSNNLYPFVSTIHQSKEHIEKLITLCKTDEVIMIGNTFKELSLAEVNYYHLSEQQLESFISRYLCSAIEDQHLNSDLKRYLKMDHVLSI